MEYELEGIITPSYKGIKVNLTIENNWVTYVNDFYLEAYPYSGDGPYIEGTTTPVEAIEMVYRAILRNQSNKT
jgi:hypothetical protein